MTDGPGAGRRTWRRVATSRRLVTFLLIWFELAATERAFMTTCAGGAVDPLCTPWRFGRFASSPGKPPVTMAAKMRSFR